MTSSVAIAAVVSFVACLALTPFVRARSLRHGIVDLPGPLKIHTRPVPRLGGVAIALSLAGGVLISARGISGTASFLAALGIIWLAGLADDFRTISPYARIAAQITSGVLLWLGGWRFLIGDFFPRQGAISLGLLCTLAVVLINAFNFLDGSDGLAAGVACVTGAAYIAVSHGLGDPIVRIVSVSLAGSCAAFLFFNFPPNAAIFMGDSGSTVLGLSVAVLALCRPHAAPRAHSLAAATLSISALPIADFALAVFRRLRSRASPLQGDRFHTYDRMLARGYSSRAVALFFYAITLALAVAAWLGLQLGLLGLLMIFTLSVAGVLGFAIALGALRGEDRETLPDRLAKLAASGERRLPFNFR